MTCHQPIRAAVAVNHDRQPCRVDRREEICAFADVKRDRAGVRARAACFLRLRLGYRIPYHEWQEAVLRGGAARELLIEAYTPRWHWQTGQEAPAPRCPPWASRRYREA